MIGRLIVASCVLSALTHCTSGDVPNRARSVGAGGLGGTGGVGGMGGTGGMRAMVRPPVAGMDGGTTDAGSRDAGSRDAAAPHRELPAPNIASIFKTGCATSSTHLELLPSNLLFVIDRSASMACNPPPTTSSADCESNPVRADATLGSKWEITRSSLSSAISLLPPEAVVGLTYFSNDDACGVHSSPIVPLAKLDEAQRSVITVSLSNVTPGGATPIVGATILAYKHLHERALAGAIHGKQFVVLLTDGQQSAACSDPDQCAGQQACTDLLVNTEVPKAAGPGVGIKTFVIGAPGSEPARSVLSQIAKNGGTAPSDCDVAKGNCHFDMTTQPNFDQALSDALSQIAGRALSCELPVPRPDGGQVDPLLVNVVYSPADGSEPSLILKDDRKACDSGADGWQYADNMAKIQLCGPSCDKVKKNPGARVDVVLGCAVRALQ
jgi:hypothetical protein